MCFLMCYYFFWLDSRLVNWSVMLLVRYPARRVFLFLLAVVRSLVFLCSFSGLERYVFYWICLAVQSVLNVCPVLLRLWFNCCSRIEHLGGFFFALLLIWFLFFVVCVICFANESHNYVIIGCILWLMNSRHFILIKSLKMSSFFLSRILLLLCSQHFYISHSFYKSGLKAIFVG